MMTKNRSITIIYGRTGTGKSSLAKKIILKYPRVIIIDPLHEYVNGMIFYDFESLIEYTEKNLSNNYTYICRFSSDIEHDYLFRFVQIIGNLLLVVEEAEIYISPTSQSSTFLNLCRYGRHQNISILGIARRVSELSINFRAFVDTIISFKQTEPRDLKLMSELGFENLDKLSEHDYLEKNF